MAILLGCKATEYTTVQIQTDDQRFVDVRVWLSQRQCDPCDVIVFSHGHGLGVDKYDVLLRAWANAGYVVLAPLHADSEQYVNRSRYAPEQYLGLRLSDLKTVIEWLERDTDESISNIRLSTRYFAAGHSFGALIAQMSGGATVERKGKTVGLELANRPVGVIAVSPPGPVDGYLSTQGWRQLRSPLLVVTGTEDVVPLFAPTWQAHLASFRAGPTGNSVALTFTGMDHYFNGAFGRINDTNVDTTAAVRALNRAILEFASVLSAEEPVSEIAWSKFDSENVQAEIR